MQSLFIFFITVLLFIPSVYAENTEDACTAIKNRESSDWIKTQKWPEYVIKRWKKSPYIIPNKLLEGFGNPVCHVFAAENNLIAGLEGLGEYPSNPKKINYVKWQDFSDFDIDNNGKPLVAPKDLRKGIELAKFDLYNNNKPIIVEKDVRKRKGCDRDYEYYPRICMPVEYYANGYIFNAYDITDMSLENFIRTRIKNRPAIKKHQKELNVYKIELKYEPVRTTSFFTYDGISYVAEREKLSQSPLSINRKKYRRASSDNDFVYRYDNGKKKLVCHYGKFPANKKKQLLALNKLFNFMNSSVKATFKEYFVYFTSYEEFLKGLDMLGITKENYAEQTIINKALLDEIYDRYNQIEKCKTGKELQPLTASLKNGKKVMQKKKASKSKDNKITLIAKEGKQIYSVMMNGKKIGILFPDDIVLDPDGNIIGKKKDNKIIDLNGTPFGTIEE